MNAGIRVKSLCIPPVNTLPHGGQIENLSGKRRGLGLSGGDADVFAGVFPGHEDLCECR